MDAQRWTEVEVPPGFGARMEAVHGDAQARHVHMRFRIAQKRRRIGAMHQPGINADLAKRRNGFLEAAQLHIEIESLSAVRRGEMGKSAHLLEGPMKGYLPNEIDHLVETHAYAVHARINGEMERRTQSVPSASSPYATANSLVYTEGMRL